MTECARCGSTWVLTVNDKNMYVPKILAVENLILKLSVSLEQLTSVADNLIVRIQALEYLSGSALGMQAE